VVAAAACLILSGCTELSSLAVQSQATRNAPLPAIRVSQRDVVVQGPPGYCVDPDTAEDRRSGAFVMLGNCAVLKGGNGPDAAGVLTAMVSPPADPPQRPSPARLQSFFTSPDGRGVLAHDGRPGSVTILSTEASDDVLFLEIRDESEGRPASLSDRAWRAVFPLADRLVALSVTAHRERPLASAEAREVLGAFVAAMKRANSSDASQL